MIYMLVEQQFVDYPWCQRILQGIYEEGRKKRVTVQKIDSPEEAGPDGGCALLVGVSESWISAMSEAARDRGLHPVALSNRQNDSSRQSLSSVVMDIHNSMGLAVDYLYSLGRKRLALFGVNPSAASDLWRAERFRELTGRGDEDIFVLKPTMEEVFGRFYSVIGRYDGAICTSDYAAVSLTGRLRDRGYRIPERLYVIGYGDMFLSRLSKPSITSISDAYEDFGRAALSICGLVEKNGTISAVNIHLRSRLHVRETTENRPYLPARQPSDESCPAENKQAENQFFRDPEMTNLAKLEMLFNQCDETDFSLLQLLVQGTSYASMAQQCFVSETAAKYRVRKMEKLCGVSTREELVRYISGIL